MNTTAAAININFLTMEIVFLKGFFRRKLLMKFFMKIIYLNFLSRYSHEQKFLHHFSLLKQS